MNSYRRGQIVRDGKDLRGGINVISAFVNDRNGTKNGHDGVTI